MLSCALWLGQRGSVAVAAGHAREPQPASKPPLPAACTGLAGRLQMLPAAVDSLSLAVVHATAAGSICLPCVSLTYSFTTSSHP